MYFGTLERYTNWIIGVNVKAFILENAPSAILWTVNHKSHLPSYRFLLYTPAKNKISIHEININKDEKLYEDVKISGHQLDICFVVVMNRNVGFPQSCSLDMPYQNELYYTHIKQLHESFFSPFHSRKTLSRDKTNKCFLKTFLIAIFL